MSTSVATVPLEPNTRKKKRARAAVSVTILASDRPAAVRTLEVDHARQPLRPWVQLQLPAARHCARTSCLLMVTASTNRKLSQSTLTACDIPSEILSLTASFGQGIPTFGAHRRQSSLSTHTLQPRLLHPYLSLIHQSPVSSGPHPQALLVAGPISQLYYGSAAPTAGCAAEFRCECAGDGRLWLALPKKSCQCSHHSLHQCTKENVLLVKNPAGCPFFARPPRPRTNARSQQQSAAPSPSQIHTCLIALRAFATFARSSPV